MQEFQSCFMGLADKKQDSGKVDRYLAGSKQQNYTTTQERRGAGLDVAPFKYALLYLKSETRQCYDSVVK